MSLPAAERWVEGLPEELQPRALLRQFPRIVNKLARLWGDAESFVDYVNHLLTDARGNRQGFPPSVHNELLNLRDYVEDRYTKVHSP